MEQGLNFLTKTAPGLLLILIVADVFSGLLKSAKNKRWSSDVSYAGMMRKVGMILAVGVCFFIENFSGLPLVAVSSLLYCATEGMSLVENLAELGVPIPKALTQYFKKIADESAADPATDFAPIQRAITDLYRRDDPRGMNEPINPAVQRAVVERAVRSTAAGKPAPPATPDEHQITL